VKTCTRCREGKPPEEFNRSSRSRDGRQAHCRSCSSEYYLSNSVKHKENVRARNKRVTAEIKIKVWQYLLENPCECGESDPTVLEFDHVRGVKRKAISRMIQDNPSWKTVLEEIGKCKVRCANCHRRRTAEQFGWYAWQASV
jgi:hypothetical protein